MKLNVHLLKFNTNSQEDLSLFPKKDQNFKTTPESSTFCYLNKHICIVHLEYKSSLQTNYQVYHIAIVLTAVLSQHTIRFIIPESKKLYSLNISVQEVQFPFNILSYYTYIHYSFALQSQNCIYASHRMELYRCTQHFSQGPLSASIQGVSHDGTILNVVFSQNRSTNLLFQSELWKNLAVLKNIVDVCISYFPSKNHRSI